MKQTRAGRIQLRRGCVTQDQRHRSVRRRERLLMPLLQMENFATEHTTLPKQYHDYDRITPSQRLAQTVVAHVSLGRALTSMTPRGLSQQEILPLHLVR